MVRRHSQGLTLVELVVSIAIIAVVVTGVMLVISNAARHSADPMLTEQATAIAQAYLEEIIGKPLADPPGGDTGRATFDDVWDYNGLSNTAGAVDQSGTVIAGLEAYNVAVQVTAVTLNGSPATQIAVTVTHDGDPRINISVSGWRLN
ncbi:MAG: type II secretion system GspH family protein [Gammaproteobacteria bacterium]|nr:type II secretion system GspH family protein [Gammaproteobacteria bacterium]MBU1656084.1 type II secretion system GspH family protein [Gammaproteobacteria bacterium]MBU1962169.1 type II secretion system GspH family protein [Gammaproteobacteria bacterium]